jgi:hypothetical protein
MLDRDVVGSEVRARGHLEDLPTYRGLTGKSR